MFVNLDSQLKPPWAKKHKQGTCELIPCSHHDRQSGQFTSITFMTFGKCSYPELLWNLSINMSWLGHGLTLLGWWYSKKSTQTTRLSVRISTLIVHYVLFILMEAKNSGLKWNMISRADRFHSLRAERESISSHLISSTKLNGISLEQGFMRCGSWPCVESLDLQMGSNFLRSPVLLHSFILQFLITDITLTLKS